MGDGGVACMPLQHSNIMERFPIQDKSITTTTATLCNGGKSNGSININNSSSSNDNNKNNNNNSNAKNGSGTGSNEFNLKPKRVVKKVIKVRKVVKKVAADKREFGLEKGAKSKKEALEKEAKSSKEGPEKEGKSSKDGLEKDAKGGKEVEKGLTSTDSKVLNSKEEVEEGELGTLKWPLKSEIENGEFVPPEKQRRSEIEKGEIGAERWRKGDAEKSDIISSKWQKGELWRDEIEKGEFIPDRWHGKDEYSHVKSRGRYDSSTERTPPSGKYSSEDVYRRKEFNRSAGNQQHAKSSLRWESSQDRNMKMSSKIVDEEGSYKGSEYNGKNQGRDYTSANRLKRHGFDSDSSERKHLGDYEDYAGIKSRRLSEDSTRAAHSEYHLHHSVERYPRHSVSSKMSSDKYSSKHHELVLSSKVVYDRHGRSPCHFERSPRDRSRCHDHRDRSPVRRERSPYSRERSPHVHERSPYVRNKSPYRREKSPQGREKSPYSREGREKSPYSHERSPYDRSHHSDRRKRSPTCSERSPRDRVGYHDRRDRNSTCLERSPLDRSKPNSREMNRKGGTSEKRISQRSSKEQEDKLSNKDSNGRDSQFSAKESQDRSSVHDFNASDEKNVIYDSHKDEESQGTGASGIKSSHVDGPPPEELLSMEEDMDICDTPPHVPVVADSSMGKWFYLDYFGIERGPSKLCDLRTLVDEGVLVSDHLIKHQDGDRWVTIENAVSPLVTMNYVSIVSNATTHHVSPPEAPGNLLAMADTVDICHSGSKSGEEVPLSDEIAAASEPLENLHIDERVRALLDGFTVSPGRELETIGEVLQTTFQHVPWDGVDNLEGFAWLPAGIAEQHDQCGDKLSNYSYKVHGFSYFAESADWFSGRWSCKGGDWKRNDEAVQDRFPRRKFILNDGFPLCQMPKSGSEDPRWHSKDDLYYPSQSRRLDLPSWAYSCTDDRSECSVGRSSLGKPPTIRGVKGTALSVVRINACVVKDHGSIVSETRIKGRSKDRHSAKSARAHSANNDVKRSHAEGDLLCRSVSDKEGSSKPAALVNTPKDRLCMVDELQLHLGEWYYLDAAGHEQGPSSFSELQVLADKGAIQKHSSVFRKIDRLWVPVSSGTETSGPMVETQQDNVVPSDSSSNTLQSDANNRCYTNSSLFHSQHPQFIGYMRGKLHQLVMKSYKSREFAAAINEVLDPWINGKQPKKEIDKHMYQKLEIDAHGGKRVRIQVDDSDEDYKMVEDLQWAQKDETTFEELCGDASFHGEGRACSEPEMGGWGLLDGHVLARIFHFLRSDIKALAFASLTCKHWRAAVNFYKDISRQVNFSSVGPNCTDAMIWGVMNGYNKEKLNSMVLVGCTNVTSGMLEDILHSFPFISSVDIRGCSQFMDLALQSPKLNWLKDRNFHRTGTCDESHSKIRSLKQISERTATFYNKKGGDTEDFGELKEYFDSVKKRDSNQLFRRSLYKRSKLFDARRSSSIPSRDARIRQWAIKQSKTHYKRMEGFLALGLKDIMKENTFDFFVPKVAEIEERMKNGYYIGHGLKSVREDISRMCRDAIKVKNRGAGDMNRIIELFLCLASRLEESSKFSYEREELMKSWKDELSTGLGSSTLKHKKKSVNARKYMSRSNGSNIVNGSLVYGEYASDREIRKRLSKLNRKSMDSGSETSDEIDRSSEDDRTDDETDSDTESDLDFQSEGQTWESKGNGYVMIDDGYSVTDEREWGARMTKASLVPPVTRKYEIIDQYVIVADEENVQRKMCVSLPDDYAEKLDAQRNGTEELDMELPEVKEYKPRKQLGDEVIEQEVYGIDPHTYNLLLDSMPAELNWTLSEKQLFIEDVLLRTLNKQVRHFTGSGNTPMIYSLKPVVEEIEIAAEEDCDVRKMRMCRAILKAIDSRPDDKYVAYRKGLGVVCNKEGGFGKDDFVVEFLGEVYPAWKWFEKQDGIRSLQKDSKDPAPEFYNINLERPKGDADGYDLVVVDAMHKANYASRICHSCRPNCEAKVTAVDGHYQIGIYTLHEVQNGEEISFDYNSVTESKEEYEASVCLCGSHGCRGSYLNLTGEGAFQKVFKEWHGILDRHYLMLEACQLNSVSEEDYLDLGRAGLGSCLLGGLPEWLVAYSARLVRFINLERTKLPEEILSYNLEEKHKYLIETSLEVERSDAELQAEGVYNQRLQNLAITLDKVSYVLRCVFDDPKKALPPLERLSPEETVSFLWKGEGSLVDQLLQCMAPHVEPDTLNDLKSKIRARDPTNSGSIQKELQKSLLWLRDELRRLSCTYKCRHDAAADLIHVYAYTKCFFRVREYKAFTSPPVYISPLDLGPKYADKLGPGIHEYKKTYGENYCLGQLIFWHVQTNLEPDHSLEKASRGCLSLPDIGSFYAKIQKPSQQRIYGPKTVKMMLERMEKYTQKPWPKDQIWSFKSSPEVFGSPMFDCVFNNTSLDKEMVHWLKHRPAIYQAMWDR